MVKPNPQTVVQEPKITYIYRMKGRLLAVFVVFGILFPVSGFSQTFYGDTLWTRDYSSSGAFSCAFSPDGTRLAVAYECMGPMVRVLNVNNGQVIWESGTPDLCLYNIQFSSSGQYIAIAEELGHLVVVDITIPDTVYNIDTQTGGLNGVDFSPAGDYIYAGGNDGTIRIYETATGSFAGMISNSMINPNGHTDGILTVDVSATGHYLATGSKDNTVKIWDISDNDNLETIVYNFTDHMADVKTVKFTPFEDRVLTGSVDDMIHSYRMSDGTLDTMLAFHTADVNTIDISADGSFAVSGSNDQSAIMFNLFNYDSITVFTNQLQTRVNGVAISPQMDKLAAVNHIGFVILYDIQTFIGIEEPEIESLIIYPNPATDFINISGLDDISPYELINLNGQVIQHGITSQIIPIHSLSKGIYILRIENRFARIIKQ